MEGIKYLNPFMGGCGVDVAVLERDSFVLCNVRDPGYHGYVDKSLPEPIRG